MGTDDDNGGTVHGSAASEDVEAAAAGSRGSERSSEVLRLVGDADCRAVLAAVVRAQEAPSVADLAATLDVPESTLYRKLDLLTETPLVDARASVSRDGHPRTRYVSAVTEITLRFDEGTSMTVEMVDGETVALDVADVTDPA